MEQIDYTYIIAVAAILIALMSLWAQSWVKYGESSSETEKRDRTRASATVGIIWIYMAIVIAVLSLCALLAGKYWEGGLDWAFEWGFGFLITAVLMCFINILESTIHLFNKAMHGKTYFEHHGGINPKIIKEMTIKSLIIVLITLTISLLGVIVNHWLWWLYLPLAVFALITYWKAIHS